MDTKGYKWLYINGDIDIVLGIGEIDWVGQGFTVRGIRWAVSHGYQSITANPSFLQSLFPIENEEVFNQTVGQYLSEFGDDVRILTQEER